jgi:hypothetical protein
VEIIGGWTKNGDAPFRLPGGFQVRIQLGQEAGLE